MAREQQVSFGEALFSGTRKKVLGLFFGQPKRAFLLSELIQLASAGSGGVQREVERLTASGLVTMTQQGRQKYYQVNQASPIYTELCAIIQKTAGPAERLKAQLDTRSEDIKLALLYGSVAKQTDRATSDIDLLLVSDTLTLEEVFNLLAPVEAELGRPINPTLYTVAEFNDRRRADHPFLSKLFKGKYVPLKGEVDGSATPG